MADTVGPESLSTRGIPSSRRGYDRRAVEQVMAAAAAQWEQLVREHRELLDRIDRAGGLEYLSADLAALSEDVGRMLTEAQRAAAGIRERAASDAEEQLSRAQEEAARLGGDAADTAFEARRRAWEEGTALLDDAVRTATAMVERAEADVLIIRAEAEQEAHRRVAAARKEGADIVRNARFEAERLVSEAKALADDLVGGAMREAEAAQERARALETRRRRMLDEIEGDRADSSGIRVVAPTGPASRPPAPSPPSSRRADSEVDALGDSLAAEVERLQGEARQRIVEPRPEPPTRPAEPEAPAAAEPDEPWMPEDGDGTVVVHGRPGPPLPPPAETPGGEKTPAEEDEPAAGAPGAPAEEEAPAPGEPGTAAGLPEVPEDVGGKPEAPIAEEPEAPVAEEPEAPTVEAEPATAGPPPVDDLFARLRGGRLPLREEREAVPSGQPEAPPARQPEAIPSAGPEPAAPGRPGSLQEEPEEAPSPPGAVEDAAAVTDPIELRERLLLPIENRGLRTVKQGLLAAQNLVLEALRVSGEWSGDFGEIGAALDAVVDEAAGAGAAAAGAFTGRPAPAPVIGGRSALVSGDLGAAVGDGVEAALEETAGSGPRERAAAVSRVFRAWRGEEAERWVRLAARTAFHDSLLAGLESLGVARVTAVPHGGTCDRCPVGAGPWEPGGDPPEGREVPPAGLDCHCTIAPAG